MGITREDAIYEKHTVYITKTCKQCGKEFKIPVPPVTKRNKHGYLISIKKRRVGEKTAKEYREKFRDYCMFCLFH